MKSVLISVTQEDINCGVRDNPVLCPIALAVQRQFPDHLVCVTERGEVAVVRGFFDECLEGNYRQLTRPFVEKFDSKLAVEPFNFTIDLDETET
jgi:hypothetical protein